MATKNYDNIRIFGDEDSDVFAAPKGTTLPTSLTIDAAFEALGWLSDDGIEEAVSVDISKFNAFQGGKLVRTKPTKTEKSVKVTCWETHPIVTEIFYGHGAPTVSGTGADTVARIDKPSSIGTIERVLLVKKVDGPVITIDVYELVQVGDRGSAVSKNDAIHGYDITFDVIGDHYQLT
ncbi:phage tail tube protein, partial [Sinomonas soli]